MHLSNVSKKVLKCFIMRRNSVNVQKYENYCEVNEPKYFIDSTGIIVPRYVVVVETGARREN